MSCGSFSSYSAKICDNCYVAFPPATKMEKAIGCTVFVILFLAVGGIISGITNSKGNSDGGAQHSAASTLSSAPDPTKEKEELRIALAHAAASDLKASMRNPDSLVIESARANEDASIMCVEYRAQNGFGGMNREFIAFDKDSKAHQQASWWNKHCKSAMYDVTIYVTP